MDSNDRELLRLSLIRWLVTKPLKFGTPARFLLVCAHSEAWPTLTVDELVEELEYLADPTNALKQSLVTIVTKLSPENTSWKITAAGRDFAAERNIS